MATNKNLPKPDPELEKPDPELPKPEKDLPLPEKEIPAHSTSSRLKPKFGNKNPIWLIVIIGLIIAISISSIFAINKVMKDSKQNKKAAISSYEECVEAGYPIQETYPEKCTIPGTASFTRELTTDEVEKLNPGIFVNENYSFEYPTNTFALAHLVCNNASTGPKLVEKGIDGKRQGPGCVYGIIFDVEKVDEIDDLINDTTCYETTSKQLTIDKKPATTYTSTFIGGDIKRCTEGMTGLISESQKLIYVENDDQLYLIYWPIHDYIDQSAYDQILSTFTFIDANSELYYSPDKSKYIYIEHKQVQDQKLPYKFHIVNDETKKDIVFYETPSGELIYNNQTSIADFTKENWSPYETYFYLKKYSPAAPNRIIIFKSDISYFDSGNKYIDLNKLLYQNEKLLLEKADWEYDSKIKLTTSEENASGPDYIFDLKTEKLYETPNN